MGGRSMPVPTFEQHISSVAPKVAERMASTRVNLDGARLTPSAAAARA
jgi:hypothetical protein